HSQTCVLPLPDALPISCNASIPLSSKKPITPIVNTATSIRASDSDEPFWNSSQTNLPRPGFWASISAAISTIQPTPSDNLSPVRSEEHTSELQSRENLV